MECEFISEMNYGNHNLPCFVMFYPVEYVVSQTSVSSDLIVHVWLVVEAFKSQILFGVDELIEDSSFPIENPPCWSLMDLWISNLIVLFRSLMISLLLLDILFNLLRHVLWLSSWMTCV